MVSSFLLSWVVVGGVFNETVVFADEEHPFWSVTVTEYVPLFAADTLYSSGLALDEVKVLGPDQE